MYIDEFEINGKIYRILETGIDQALSEKRNWATIKSSGIPEITSESSLRTYFYNQRKSASRVWQFEVSTGGNENIVAGLGGRPDGAKPEDRAFIYIILPYSEAGGYIIKAQYVLRDKKGIWEKTLEGTLDAGWKDYGWMELGKGGAEVAIDADPVTKDTRLQIRTDVPETDLEIPTELAELNPDSLHQLVTQEEKDRWNEEGWIMEEIVIRTGDREIMLESLPDCTRFIIQNVNAHSSTPGGSIVTVKINDQYITIADLAGSDGARMYQTYFLKFDGIFWETVLSNYTANPTDTGLGNVFMPKSYRIGVGRAKKLSVAAGTPFGGGVFRVYRR